MTSRSPAPWSTDDPREGLRASNDARIYSLTPGAATKQVGNRSVPHFGNMVDFCDHAENYSTTVRFTSQAVLLARSWTSHTHGGGGGICEPIGHATQVRVQGSPVVRDGDAFFMDDRKTVGEASFVRNTEVFAPPEDTDPLPDMSGVQLAFNDETGRFTGPPTTTRPPNPSNRLSPWYIEPLDRVTGGALSKQQIETFNLGELNEVMKQHGDTPEHRQIIQDGIDRINQEALPWGDKELGTQIYDETIERLAEQLKREEADRTVLIPPPKPEGGGNVRVSGDGPTKEEMEDCGIRTHAENKTKCGPLGASHHGMVDFPFRTGTRAQTEREDPADHRAPGAPKFNLSYTICVPVADEPEDEDNTDEGDGEGTGEKVDRHAELHRDLNKAIHGSGVNGLTDLETVRKYSFQAIDKLPDNVLTPACKIVYKRVLDNQYAISAELPLRASPYRPLPSKNNDVGRALSKAWNFRW